MKRFIKVQFRRRRKKKTDYGAREKMLSGRVPRMVIRKTNRYIIAQIVKSENAQDMVVSHTLSKELLKYGWPDTFSIKNLAAAYLTGFLAASKVRKETKKAVLDMGMIRSTKGNRIYAALKGAIDAGLEIPHSEKNLPEMKRIEQNKKADINKIKEKIGEKFK